MSEDQMNKAFKKLDKEIRKIKDASQAAFWEAGLKIMGASMPKTPVDSGNLRGSAYIRNAQGSEKLGEGSVDSGSVPSDTIPRVGVEIGYYADYAMAVHENTEQKWKGKDRPKTASGKSRGSFWDEGEPKFLESVIVANLDLIPKIIKERTEMDKEKKI